MHAAHVTQCIVKDQRAERAVFVEKCVRAVRVVYFRANTRSAARPKAAAVSCEALGARRMTQNRFIYTIMESSVRCDFPIWLLAARALRTPIVSQ
jgi:hypothetical protein